MACLEDNLPAGGTAYAERRQCGRARQKQRCGPGGRMRNYRSEGGGRLKSSKCHTAATWRSAGAGACAQSSRPATGALTACVGNAECMATHSGHASSLVVAGPVVCFVISGVVWGSHSPWMWAAWAVLTEPMRKMHSRVARRSQAGCCRRSSVIWALKCKALFVGRSCSAKRRWSISLELPLQSLAPASREGRTAPLSFLSLPEESDQFRPESHGQLFHQREVVLLAEAASYPVDHPAAGRSTTCAASQNGPPLLP